MRAFRKISVKRARKLRLRGEEVLWVTADNSYVWYMTHKHLNRWKGDITRVHVKPGL